MQTTTERPAESVRAIESGLAIQDRERLTSLQALARLRNEARDEIARLIDFLDQSDLYALTEVEEDDAEPSDEQIRFIAGHYPPDEHHEDNEPSLCGITVNPLGMIGDCKHTCDREAEADGEYSIGSTTSVNQEYWAHGDGDDLEDEHDGAEASLCGIYFGTADGRDLEGNRDDDEPSLGWTIEGRCGGSDDREAEPYVHAHRQNRTLIPGANEVRPKPYFWTKALDGLTPAQEQMLSERSH